MADDTAAGVAEWSCHRLDCRHHSAIGKRLNPLVAEQATALIGNRLRGYCQQDKANGNHNVAKTADRIAARAQHTLLLNSLAFICLGFFRATETIVESYSTNIFQTTFKSSPIIASLHRCWNDFPSAGSRRSGSPDSAHPVRHDSSQNRAITA